MHTIREFTYSTSDYQAVADLFEAICGNSHHRPENIQHMDEIRGSEIPFARFIAETEGKIIAEGAYGQSLWFRSANKLNLNILIHPEFDANDLREAMYAHLVKEASLQTPEAFFFAVDGDRYVAITGLTHYDEITYMADLTWAIPSHQDRGIELALKLRTLKWATEKGATYIVDEAVEDDPAYHINIELGFEHLPAWSVLEKQH